MQSSPRRFVVPAPDFSLLLRSRRTRGLGGAAALAVCVCSCFLGVAPAFASSTAIFFDFTANSSISILGGIIVTPPDGTMDTGSARLEVEATDETTFVPGGTASLSLVNFAGTVSKNVSGVADISGPYSGSQVGTADGTINAGLDTANFTTDLMINLNVVFGCTGSGCGTLGFPISEVGLSALSLDPLFITDIDIDGGASISATVPVELDGVQGVLNLVGVEVARNFIVPEPGTFSLLGLGLLSLAALRRHDRPRISESPIFEAPISGAH